MMVEESTENPLMYNLCMAITHTDIIMVKNLNLLDTETMVHLLSLKKNLAEIKEQLLDLILNRNLQIVN